MRIVVLLNENAGAFHPDAGGSIRETLLSEFTKRGIVAEVEALPSGKLAGAANSALQKANRKDVDAIVAGGGDGTIGAVAAILAGTGIPLGVLPLGTLNHFARDLGIPLDVAGAVEVIAASNCRTVDVGEVNDRIFLNNSSIGVYPFMVRERERRQRLDGLSKWPAMAWAAFDAIRLFPLRRFHVHAHGRSESPRTPCLFVGNNHYRLDLFGLGKREQLNSGQLWLYITKQQTRLSLVWFTLRAVLGLADPQRDLVCFPAASAKITSRKKLLSVATDGEVEWMRPPLHYRIRPSALRVFAPTEKPSQSV